jgi:hypothetical protein
MDSRDKFAAQDGYQAPTIWVDGGGEEDDYEFELPTKNIVCPLCDGEGKHVNPSLDSNGLDREDREDEEFMHMYMNGGYDVPCYSCKGNKVVRGLDEGNCTEEQLKEFYDQQQQAHDSYLENQAELRMGA